MIKKLSDEDRKSSPISRSLVWDIIELQPSNKMDSADMLNQQPLAGKPFLWYVKGPEPKILGYIEDSVESQRSDKTLHQWIQSTDEAEHILSKLTNPNDVVLDPLIGTGTTAISALKLNRRFIGIDVSAEMLATARNRISQLISSAQRLQGENVN